MSSIVIDLQDEILSSDCDIVQILRRAHVIAVKLGLYANICSFNGHAKTGRGVVSWGNSSAVLAGCALHNLEIAVEASWGGRIGVYGEDPKTECSGNTIGIYLRQGGLVLLGDLVPDLLGGTYNERNRMNAIIKGGKFV